VTVEVEGVGELEICFLVGGRKLCCRGEGSEVMMAESCLGAATAPPKRRDEDGCVGKSRRGGWEMTEGSSSSKTAGKGSSSPCSVTQTARRGTGRGAKRILRRLVQSWAEPVLWRGRRSSSET
jgi:hypothetical protein